jgi:hypothetical protein
MGKLGWTELEGGGDRELAAAAESNAKAGS